MNQTALPAVAHLLNRLDGSGATVCVAPATPCAHHFATGTGAAPTHSLLDALLRTLGGDLPDGRRRYNEIAVVSAGAAFGLDLQQRPEEEVLRLAVTGEEALKRGQRFETWIYRSPQPAASPAPPVAALTEDHPDPGDASDWRANMEASQHSEGLFPPFPIQIPLTQQGVELSRRHEALARVAEELGRRPHPTLLMVEIDILDYPSTALAPQDHPRQSEVGIELLRWLPGWIDERARRGSQLDVVLYSRFPERLDAFTSTGLPRRPVGLGDGVAWPTCRYLGRNLDRIAWPAGSHPWGRQFRGDKGFQRVDGTPGDKPEGQLDHGNRTLRRLLRDHRVQLAQLRPHPPIPTGVGHRLDPGFWAKVELDTLEQAISQELFGAEENAPLRGLLSALRRLQASARIAESAEAFHFANIALWQRATRLLAWGTGGSGKSMLGKVLCPLLYGHEALVIKCDRMPGSAQDPAASFKHQFFGAPPGHVGSDQLTPAGQHIVETGGYTVIVFDEFNRIADGDLSASLKALYSLLEDRSYLPANGPLTGNREISLWNAVILLTANLAGFPGPGVAPQDVDAIKRRVSAHRFSPPDRRQALDFASWYLRKQLQADLGGVTICHCEDLRPELERRGLEGTNLDDLSKGLWPVVAAAKEIIDARGINPSNAPLFLDVTAPLRAALS